MTFELTQAEYELLAEVLEERLHSLRVEIQHTDSRAFRAMLLAREHLLQSVCDRLSISAAA